MSYSNFFIGLLIVLLTQSNASNAQQPYLLTIFPDAETVISSGTFTALPSDIPSSFFYNPAQLGNFGAIQKVSLQYLPGGNQWLFDGIRMENFALTGGYSIPNTPLNFGIGIIRNEIDFGKIDVRAPDLEIIDRLSTFDRHTTFGMGIQLDHILKLNVGYSYKVIRIHRDVDDTRTSGHDLGIQAGYTKKINDFSLVVNLGYSIRNEGKSFIQSNEGLIELYRNAGYDYPDDFTGFTHYLPRTQTLGYSLGFDYSGNIFNREKTIISLNWTVDATKDVLRPFTNEPAIRNLNLKDLAGNLIEASTDIDTEINMGIRIGLMESLTIGGGRNLKYRFQNPVYTAGFSINVLEIAQFFYDPSPNKPMSYVLKHFDASFSYAVYIENEDRSGLDGQNLSSIVIRYSFF